MKKAKNQTAYVYATAAFAEAKGLTAGDPSLTSWPELRSAVDSMFEVDASSLN